MIEQIAHYPAQLRSAVQAVSHNPLAGHQRLRDQSTKLTLMPTTVSFGHDRFSDQAPTWITATLGPCVFIAATAKNEAGKITEARAGHFTSDVSDHEINLFMSNMPSPPTRTNLWIAGLANKTCRETLLAASERLVNSISALGIPLELHWQAHNRPVIRDTRTGHPISDIGLGLITENRSEFVTRIIAFGIAEEKSVFISTLAIL
ncbi:MAG: hypothetical protein KJ732_05390, partial [Candidatus Margulisbacteria bacterium]|nr:hypothetical protein [Candidatus Margulisiibacteriota bacterium]